MRRTGFDKTTFAAIGCTGIQRAGHLSGATVEIGQQQDAPFTLGHGLCLDGAGVADHGRGQGVGALGGQHYLAAIGLDQPAVADEHLRVAGIDGDLQVAIGPGSESHLLACGQRHVATVGDDLPGVADAAADQRDGATVTGGDAALVDHLTCAAALHKAVLAG